MLPPTYLDWIVDQPEAVLSAFEAHREFMRADWILMDSSIIHEHIFKSAISKHMTRRLDKLEQVLATEIPVAVQTQIVPADDYWHEVDSYFCWKKAVLQVVSRAFVGDLCAYSQQSEPGLTRRPKLTFWQVVTKSIFAVLQVTTSSSWRQQH